MNPLISGKNTKILIDIKKRKTVICRICYKKYYIEGKVPERYICTKCFVKTL